MEPSGRNRGNRWQIAKARSRRSKPRAVAVGCDQLPESFHGKEGVDGSSPSEGSAKAPHTAAFRFGSICRSSNVGQVWSPVWSLQVENARCGTATAAASTGGPRWLCPYGRPRRRRTMATQSCDDRLCDGRRRSQHGPAGAADSRRGRIRGTSVPRAPSGRAGLLWLVVAARGARPRQGASAAA
jgi:hypothetical protein